LLEPLLPEAAPPLPAVPGVLSKPPERWQRESVSVPAAGQQRSTPCTASLLPPTQLRPLLQSASPLMASQRSPWPCCEQPGIESTAPAETNTNRQAERNALDMTGGVVTPNPC